MNPLLERLHALEDRSAASLDDALAPFSFPYQDGTRTTFVYRGPADGVELMHWIYGLQSSQAFRRLEGSDLWYLTLELPPASRIEYKFLVTRAEHHRLLRDPLNPSIARDPFGANSVCQVDGYESPEWTEVDPEARRGTVEEIRVHSKVFDKRRSIKVYVPARFRSSRRYSLLVVHDGRDYVRYADLETILDNLIYRLEIPPLIVALTNSPNRLEEYAGHPDHARFVVEELLPKVEKRYPLRAEAHARALMGASFGGVAALSTAWRYPGVFGKLLLQSGSFAFTDIGKNPRGPRFEPVVEFVNAFREAPGRPADRIYVSCGKYESLIYENRSLVPVLQRTGANLRYTEAPDGHNWQNWRDRLREGLSFLFPGPLWMVYE